METTSAQSIFPVMTNDIISINGVEYAPVQPKLAENIFVIRSYAAGVFYGEIESKDYTASGLVVKAKNVKRIWSWSGACSLSQLATNGVADGTRISVSVPSEEIINVVEILGVTPKALKSLEAQPIWKK